MRISNKFLTVALGVGMTFMLTACGRNNGTTTSASNSPNDQTAQTSADRTGTADRAATPDTGQNSADRTGATTNMSNADKEFVRKAAEGGMAEVQMGQMAKDHGNSQYVKDYGNRLVTDHTKANDELKSTVGSNFDWPTDVTKKDKDEMDRLSKMTGDQFDRAFMKHEVTDHKKDISEFQKEANSGSDPNVKAFAAKSLPVLQEHLRIAEDYGKGNAVTSNATGTSGHADRSQQTH